MDYHFRELEHSEFHLLIPLMKECFGMDVNIDYFRWKFLNNPVGLFKGYIAIDKTGEIAAYYGVIPELYLIDGIKTVIYQSCDTMTHPNHRRKGLFQQLASFCYNKLEQENKLFIVGFGGGQSTPGFIKFGWRFIFNMRYVFYPRQFILFPQGNKKRNQVVDIKNIKDIDGLITKRNNKYKVQSYRDCEIYEWRISNPKHDYKIIGLQRDQEIHSYLCYYNDSKKIVLLDFWVENKKDLKILLNKLKFKCKEQKLKGIISFEMENSESYRLLKKCNFLSNPFKKGPLSEVVPFIFYSDEDKMNRFENKNYWFLNSFDHDSI